MDNSEAVGKLKKEIRMAKKFMTEGYQFNNTNYRDGYIQGLQKAIDFLQDKNNPELGFYLIKK